MRCDEEGFIGSDPHCGHKSGLTTPQHRMIPDKRASRQAKKAYEQRIMLWDWFANQVKKCGPFDVGLWNGDLIDGKGEKSGGTEELTTDRKEQAEWAAEIIKFVEPRRTT